MGRGQPAQPLVRGWVVVSTAVAALPKHKQNPGTARERAKRARAHAQHRAHKQGRTTKPPSATAQRYAQTWVLFTTAPTVVQAVAEYAQRDRKSTRLNSSHLGISYAVFCLKKKKQ